MKQDPYLKSQLNKNTAIYTALMKGYKHCDPPKPKKMLNVFKMMVNQTHCKIFDVHINMKADAYIQLIKDHENDSMKYLEKLLYDLPKERERLVSSVSKYSQQLASLQLKGCCIVYGNNFNLIVPIFEQYLQPHIGYWRKIKDGNGDGYVHVLDFYHFSEIITKFILKYVYEYQKGLLVQAVDDDGYLRILCDDGLSNKYKEMDDKNGLKFQENSGSLKHVIQKEIRLWDDCISMESHRPDELLIQLNTELLRLK